MFIWTISDVIGVVIGGFAVLFFGGLFALIKLDDWHRARKARLASSEASKVPDDR